MPGAARVLLVLLLSGGFGGGRTQRPQQQQELRRQPPAHQQRGLFPAVLNLASNALITTNATCGEKGPEMYCKLVEHVPGQPVRNPQCRICNQNSSNPYQRHPITNAIDGKNTWWQSPSIKNGIEYHYVTITLDLQQVFQIAYVIVKAANSPRPGNWILERSLDDVDYKPWQYHAVTDTECLTLYNIYPRTGPPSYAKDDEVICTSFYSKIHPLENGEVSPNHPRPCQPCHCDPVGSLNEVCVKDEKRARRGLAPGSCHCKPGFKGVSCDRCARGYTGYPDCRPCNCSGAGSTNEDPCFGPCKCKENVEGGDCSRCKSGFFNLQEDNHKGCDECFCSGVSNRCQSSYWTYGNIQDMSGWYLTDISGHIRVAPQQDDMDPPRQISISSSEARRALPQSYFWSAPAPYLGNKASKYHYEKCVNEQNTFLVNVYF